MIRWIGGVAFVTGVVLVSIAMFLLLRRNIDFRRLEQHNDVAGFIYAVIGVIYGVLIAFVVIVVWEHHSAAERAVQNEANTIMQIYRDADAFPDPFQRELRNALRTYTLEVTTREIRGGYVSRASGQVQIALDSLWHTYSSFVPQDDNDRVWYAEILTRLNALAQDRELRITAIRHHLPTIMWVVLGIGGAITIAFSYLFGTSNTAAHVLMIAGLSVTMSLSILLVWSLSHPYSGLGEVDLTPMHRAAELVGGG